MAKNPLFGAKLEQSECSPLYAQLASIISRCILTGVLKPGDMLPSESELCRHFDISRSTVRQAIGSLEDDGFVVRKQGRGTFVAERSQRRRTEAIYSFTSEMSALGLNPTSTIIEFGIQQPPPEIAATLELSTPGTAVYRFVRLRNVNGQPLILETTFFPVYIYPHLTRETLSPHSLYSLLYEVGIVPGTAMDTYEAALMSDEEADLLGCDRGSCALVAHRRTRSVTGMFYEYTRSVIRADRVKLDVLLHRDGVTFTRSVDK